MAETPTSPGPPPTYFQPPTQLPREIIDHILSALVSLYADDPAYQWIHLRCLTRFHRNHLHHHFLHYWLPKLLLTLYDGPDTYVEYCAWGLQKSTGKVRFKVKRCVGENANFEQPTPGTWWHDRLMRTTYPIGDERRRGKYIILRMGEGVLNEGYAGGGLLSDMQLPGLEVDACAANLWFDWQAAFSRLFGEEMVMQRFREKLLRRFSPATVNTRTVKAQMCVGRRAEVHGFLRDRYQPLRRELLVRYRDHLSSSTSTPTPFNINPHIVTPRLAIRQPGPRSPVHSEDGPTIHEFAFVEESMVFHVPGWETWDVRDVARLRAVEQQAWFQGNVDMWRAGGLGALGFRGGVGEKWEGWDDLKRLDEEAVRRALRVRMGVDDRLGHMQRYFRY